MKKKWLFVTTALGLLLQGRDPVFCMMETGKAEEVSSSVSLALVPRGNSNNLDSHHDLESSKKRPLFWLRGQSLREQSQGTEPSSLNKSQALLREAILRGTIAEDDLCVYAQRTLQKSKPQLQFLISSLKYPAELIESENPSDDNPLSSDERPFHKINALLLNLEEEKNKLLPRDSDLPLFQELIHYYTTFKQKVLEAKTSKERKQLLEPKVRLTGDHLGSYLISQQIAQELSWRDLYGFQPIKGNQFGNHRVLGKGGAHFKLSPAAHTEEGGINELHPGLEYAVSSLYQLLDARIAPPSTLLALQDQALHQLPLHHPFTKGLQLLVQGGETKIEEFLHHNPGVREVLEKEGIQTYKESRFLQASLTTGDISLEEFLIKAQEDPTLLNKIDRASFSALCIASLLTNPSDGKPDNYRVTLHKDAKGNLLSAVITAIDNDEAFVPSVFALRGGEHVVGIKNVLYFLKPLMEESFDKTFLDAFLKKSPEAFLLEWVDSLKEQNRRYMSLLQEGVLTEKALQNLSLPIRFSPGLLVNLYEKLVVIHKRLKEYPNISHTALFKNVDPLAWYYYDALMGLSSENLLKIVARKDDTCVKDYQDLLKNMPSQPLFLNSLLYGQGGLLLLTFKDLCDLNQGIVKGNKMLTMGDALGDFQEKEGEMSLYDYGERTEDLEQSWQALARKTDVGVLLLKKAKEMQDHFLAGKLLALGVGDIRDILAGVATLDQRITKLNLNQKELTDKHAKELGDALAKNPYLEELSLEGNQITGGGLVEIMKGISHQKKIISLNLEKNPLTFKGISFLKPLQQLESLNLCQTLITDEDIHSLFKADALSALKHLNVSKTKITAQSGEILGRYLNALLTLNLSRTGAALGMIQTLSSNNHIKELDLSHTKINDEMILQLVRALQSNKTLTHLNLRYNQITEKSGKALAEMLSTNKTIVSLDLGNNGLGDKGLEELAGGIAKNTNLENLNLSRNFIKDEGALALYKLLRGHPSLKTVHLDYNGGMSDKVIQKLKKLQEIKTFLQISMKRLYE